MWKSVFTRHIWDWHFGRDFNRALNAGLEIQRSETPNITPSWPLPDDPPHPWLPRHKRLNILRVFLDMSKHPLLDMAPTLAPRNLPPSLSLYKRLQRSGNHPQVLRFSPTAMCSIYACHKQRHTSGMQHTSYIYLCPYDYVRTCHKWVRTALPFLTWWNFAGLLSEKKFMKFPNAKTLRNEYGCSKNDVKNHRKVCLLCFSQFQSGSEDSIQFLNAFKNIFEAVSSFSEDLQPQLGRFVAQVLWSRQTQTKEPKASAAAFAASACGWTSARGAKHLP